MVLENFECFNDFRGMFNDIECPLGCGNIDTIQNVLICPVLYNYMRNNSITTSKVEYEDIFSDDVIKQKQITQLYVNLMTIREKLLKSMPV